MVHETSFDGTFHNYETTLLAIGLREEYTDFHRQPCSSLVSCF